VTSVIVIESCLVSMVQKFCFSFIGFIPIVLCLCVLLPDLVVESELFFLFLVERCASIQLCLSDLVSRTGADLLLVLGCAGLFGLHLPFSFTPPESWSTPGRTQLLRFGALPRVLSPACTSVSTARLPVGPSLCCHPRARVLFFLDPVFSDAAFSFLSNLACAVEYSD
jgi:hypothetical protein